MRKMVDMAKSPEEIKESSELPVMSEANKYPYGLCIRLTGEDLKKLDLDDEVGVDDMLYGCFMAKATSVSKNDTGSGTKTTVEMQIVALGVESEDEENDEVDHEEEKRKLTRRAARPPY